MFRQETTANSVSNGIHIEGKSLSLSQFNDLVKGNTNVALPLSEALTEKLSKSVDVVSDALKQGAIVYGITTGFGGMSNSRIDCQSASDLQSNLLAFLAAGAGAEVDSSHTLGAMLLRANVLLQGKSGVRAGVVEQLLRFFQHRAVPVVRELGSIGASGDLIPLSTIARAITGGIGRVRVRFGNEVVDAKESLERLGLQPIELRPKEGLALINGTSFSCSIAANTTIAAQQSLAISFAVQSLLMTALKVNVAPFADFVHQAKPHPGQVWSAKVMRGLLRSSSGISADEQVQDRYSLRCFPQYTGSIVEGIARIGNVVETEMNSVSDNPLIDVENGEFHQSGNFLGQYVGIAMDDLRRFFGLLAKHLDVQIASLVAPEFNRGLSPSLRGNDERSSNMGLKGLQICGNSIMPMLTWQANPIVEHFPTHAEQFNQNVNGLSWGAANMAWNSVKIFRQYLAVSTLFSIQAVDLRAKSELGHFDGRELLSDEGKRFYEAACEVIDVTSTGDRPLLLDDTDRWLEEDIERLANDISAQGKLVDSVQPTMDSFHDFCRSHG